MVRKITVSKNDYYTHKNSRRLDNGKGGFQVMSDLPKPLNRVLKHIDKAETASQIYSVLEFAEKNIPEFEQLESILYKFKNYHIVSALAMFADKQVDNLKIANSLNVSSAPKLVAYKKINANDVVFVTEIPDTENAELIPISKFSNDLDNNVVSNLTKDLKKLAKNGYVYNPKKLKQNILVNSETNKIVIYDWKLLKKAQDAQEMKDFLEFIDSLSVI